MGLFLDFYDKKFSKFIMEFIAKSYSKFDLFYIKWYNYSIVRKPNEFLNKLAIYIFFSIIQIIFLLMEVITMENKMNVMGFMDQARVVEDARIARDRECENSRFKCFLSKVFEDNGCDEREFNSFELAALMGMAMKKPGDTNMHYSRMYRGVKEFITKPFTCTITRRPGRTEKEFEYEVENVVKMKPMGKMSYEVNAEWLDEVIGAFAYYLSHLTDQKKIFQLANELKALYTKYVSM